jgi:hypothetical protein
MNISCLLLQIVTGIAAGNVLASGMKHFHLGVVVSSIAGGLGGGIGGQIFLRLTGVESNFHSSDAQIFLVSVFGAASGGVLVIFIAAFVKRLFSRTS